MTIFCSECGTQSKTGTKFCISCGNKLSEVNKQEEVRDKDKKSELSIVENVDYDEVLKDKKKPTIVTSIDVEPTIATKTESKPVVTEPVTTPKPTTDSKEPTSEEIDDIVSSIDIDKIVADVVAQQNTPEYKADLEERIALANKKRLKNREEMQ